MGSLKTICVDPGDFKPAWRI